MRAVGGSKDPWLKDVFADRKFGRPVLLFGALLMVMALATGCSMAQDFDTSTTVPPQETTTLAVASETTTTLLETTLLPTTTTTEPEDTTTTTEAVETTTTSEALETTTSVATSTTLETAGTTTTVPPATEDAGDSEPVETETPDGQLPEDEVLYEIADWSDGVSGWAAAGQWKAAEGMLVTDGSSDSFAVAPVDLTGYQDYAVECEVQIIDPTDETTLLLMARMINGTGYYGGFDGLQSRMVVGYDATELAGVGFFLDDEWHTYRLEVRGNTIRLFLGQAEVARAMDNHELEPGTVGIYCGSGQINVRSFKVTAL